jgi:hypothetical protein
MASDSQVSPDGRWLWDGTAWTPAKSTLNREPRADFALAVGILSLVLIWPFGILLGPLAVGLGWAGLRRIGRSQRTLGGTQTAIAGIAFGGVVCGLYLFVVIVEIASIMLFGQAIPAAP